MEQIISKLKLKYPNCNFMFKEDDLFLTLLYSDENLESDDDFFNEFCNLASHYIPHEKQLKLSVMYDYFDIIIC